MKRLVSILLLAPACYGGERAVSGKCPPGETCSSSTPYGLDFVPPALFDTVLIAGDTQVAVGGTMPIDLETYANAFNFVGQLRKRFEDDPEQPTHFITVRGSGYRFDP